MSKNIQASILAGAALVMGVAYALFAGTAGQAQTPAAVHVPMSISTNSLMVALVDQAAHEIWDGGNQERDLTDREWLLIEQHSLQLAAAATLVSLGGTGPADRGWALSPAWQEWSRKLDNVAMSASQAVAAKDRAALRTAGDALVETCEGCHKVFKPELPSEGIIHQPHYHGAGTPEE